MEQRTKVLRAITLLTQKRTGIIKGRTVADGSTQREYIDKNEATSPALSNEALVISVAIDAYEKRFVATTDVEGAYLNAFMDDLVYMVYEGDMVKYLVESNPTKYQDYIHTNKSGKKLLYVKVNKALYGCVKSAQLWYNEFAGTLKEMGFKKIHTTHASQIKTLMEHNVLYVGMSTI